MMGSKKIKTSRLVLMLILCLSIPLNVVRRLGLGICPSTSHNHTLTHSHTLLITCTCCYDLTKGTQDKDSFYSFSVSLSLCVCLGFSHAPAASRLAGRVWQVHCVLSSHHQTDGALTVSHRCTVSISDCFSIVVSVISLLLLPNPYLTALNCCMHWCIHLRCCQTHYRLLLNCCIHYSTFVAAESSLVVTRVAALHELVRTVCPNSSAKLFEVSSYGRSSGEAVSR